jgi:micrococcal nuclease
MAHDFKKFPELTNNQMAIYYFESPHKQITEDFEGKVIKVTDGDTVRMEVSFRDFTFPVRFIDTAAPERDEPGGKESKEWLENKILGEEVQVRINPGNRVGKWGRILGEIFFRGLSINEESVLTGHAVPWEERKEGKLPDFDKELDEVRI